jgi:hypothetical protein
MPRCGWPARRGVSRRARAHEKNPALSVDRKHLGTSKRASHPARPVPAVAPHGPRCPAARTTARGDPDCGHQLRGCRLPPARGAHHRGSRETLLVLRTSLKSLALEPIVGRAAADLLAAGGSAADRDRASCDSRKAWVGHSESHAQVPLLAVVLRPMLIGSGPRPSLNPSRRKWE